MNSTIAGTGPESPEPLNPNKPRWPSGRALSNGRARPRIGDPLFKLATGLFAVSIAGLAVLIVVEMALGSKLPFQKFGFGFLTRSI